MQHHCQTNIEQVIIVLRIICKTEKKNWKTINFVQQARI